MNSSRNINNDILLSIYKERDTVFRLKDIAMLVNDQDFRSLNWRLNYYVRTGRLLNPRKGIYAKPGFRIEELACKLYTPSYISLEYVLQRSGIIFQYDSSLTSVSYLSRTVEINEQKLIYRKMKGAALISTGGIIRKEDNINIAMAERAFLDLCYLDKDYYFDNLNPLDREKVFALLPLYSSAALTDRVKKVFIND
jgi:hypothetical protein